MSKRFCHIRTLKLVCSFKDGFCWFCRSRDVSRITFSILSVVFRCQLTCPGVRYGGWRSTELTHLGSACGGSFFEVVSAPTQGPFSVLRTTVAYRERYLQTISAVELFGLENVFIDQQENVEIAAAVNKLVRFLRSQQLSYVHSALHGVQNERDAFFRTLAREQHSAALLPSSNSRRMLQGCKPFHTLYISLCTFLHVCHASCIHTMRVRCAFCACALVCIWEKRFS